MRGMKFAVLGVALGVMLSAAAQMPLRTLLVGVDRRAGTSLNGDWHYIVDPAGRGLYGERFKIRDNGYAKNMRPLLVGERNGFEEYDFATAPTLKVPGDWNTQEPTLFRYESILWYQRDFTYKAKPGMRTFLHIGAANYKSYVWVNQKHVCDHEGGFTPFDCEVTGALTAGNNFVVIAVDSARREDQIPAWNVDWFNYGGLTRDVSLVDVPQAFIDDYDVHLKRGTMDTISGYVHVEGSGQGPVSVSIPELGIATTAAAGADGKATFEAKAKGLSLWGPTNPKLYKVQLKAGGDSLTDDIGFRDVRVEGTKILLNGRPIFLRGADAHAEAPGRTGRVTNDADVDGIFGYLKDLNANFVRLSHYPNDERMERKADKVGVMIWSEIPIWQRIQYENPAVYEKASAMLKEMVRRDRNKASVILWSVANETPNEATRTEFLTRLANEARGLDETRPITAAFLQPQTPGDTKIMNDPFALSKALDVVGLNEYVGWYTYLPAQADHIKFELPQKPIIVSEFGSEAKFGNHGSIDQRWTEEQQEDFYKHSFVMLGKIPQVRGFALWVLADFRSPTRNIPGLQDGFNRKGLISEKGEKKKAFYYVQQIYKEGTIGKAE